MKRINLEKLKRTWIFHPKVKSLLHWAETTSFPGLKGVPVFHIAKFIYYEFKNETLGTKANSIAFSFFISMFPMIMLFFSLLPYLPIENVNQVIQNLLEGIVPDNAKTMIFELVDDVTLIPRGRLMSLVFFLAIYFSSNGMLSLMNSFDREYVESFKKRGVIKKRAIAILLTGFISTFVIIAMTMIITGNKILRRVFDFIHADTITRISIQGFRWLVIILLYYSIIAFILRFGTTIKNKLGFISIGAIVATFLSIFISIGFSYFVNNFSTYNKFYGSLGTLIALMAWIQLNAYVVLIGFELNAAVIVNCDLDNVIDNLEKQS